MKYRHFFVIALLLLAAGCESKPAPVVPVTTGSGTPPTEAAPSTEGAAPSAPAPPPP